MGFTICPNRLACRPWYWWADVTPDHHDALYVKSGKYQQGEPSVKYRGIFLNDEKPDLDYWVRAKFGQHPNPADPNATVANFNSQFYSRIFEVILRMKGNYLWPAMWNNAFAEDDTENPRLADEYGIVMGTSHQEPMLRAQKEWDWHLGRQFGNWNFATHESQLTDFWHDAVKQRQDLREYLHDWVARRERYRHGPGASRKHSAASAHRGHPAEDSGTGNRETSVKFHRSGHSIKRSRDFTRMVFAFPMTSPCYGPKTIGGNIRRLPTAEERRRSGGAGVYYHFDYHGGPRSYQWINTNPIAKIWEQMSLAKAVRRRSNLDRQCRALQRLRASDGILSQSRVGYHSLE
jgi:hypothetical protein